MSSTNRGTERNKEDYYVTPHWMIREFLEATELGSPNCKTVLDLGERLLDPAAGGCEKYEMSYPTVLNQFNFEVDAWDIREDSRAALTGVDFLKTEGKGSYDTVITNPPFKDSTEFVVKAMEHVRERGLIIMLQRLNWLGSVKRFQFWGTQPLHSVFVHHKRAGFNPEKPNDKDSIEYAHFVFRKGYNNLFAPNLYII
ncbi:SAM-dependent methyltransferase [Pseudoalteromonas obscura]|uniref:SAM-dependent methyltransferase n=1 Tax=Pseudoalteromonas obscura TaxID=3048491 RepID=A0ABT7ES95_9GAMM|nr:SAM-dependent methyltransferase [Pseudoalteromonas sp. P94(2023)]MDK2597921.1 SAM-dependent methyltransferase [Pseudoalteromonas sp. P94(2023)]